MPEADRELNLYQKLAKIRKPVEILQKNKSGYGYKYVSEDVILAKITGLMDKLGVSLIPNIVRGSTEVSPYHYMKTKATKQGEIYEEHVNEIIVRCDMEWIWVNNDQPAERIIVPWTLVGQQSDASQAFGSGLSYCTRYFLLKYFNAATSEADPDNWKSVQKEAEEQEGREIAAGIIEQVNATITSHLQQKPEDRDEVITIVKKYAKEKGKPSGNPNAIKDPVIAGKLMEEVNARYGAAS